MGKKYIIELLDDCPSEFKGIIVFGLTPEGQISAEPIPVEDLTPYTEPDLERVRLEAEQLGMVLAWDAAKKIENLCEAEKFEIFGEYDMFHIMRRYTAYEVIEKIRQYEQSQKELERVQKEKEKLISTEEVMRKYLDEFCKSRRCGGCILNTSDFTCGRGYHFLTEDRVSDEEVRRAYAEVMKK